MKSSIENITIRWISRQTAFFVYEGELFVESHIETAEIWRLNKIINLAIPANLLVLFIPCSDNPI